MRKYLSILMSLLIVFSFCACGKKDKSTESVKMQFKQRIAKVYPDGILGEKRIADFDSSGNMTKEVRYSVDGSILYTEEFKYDSEARLTEKTNNNGIYRYEYDKDGNLIRETTCDKDGSIVRYSDYEYDFDASGRITVRTELSSSGELLSRVEYEYDSSGNRIKETFFRENVDLYTPSRIESESDSSGRIVKESYIYEDGRNDYSIEYCYDASGNLTGELYYTYSHGLRSWIVYEYI